MNDDVKLTGHTDFPEGSDENYAYVVNVQRFTIHDGPGIRTELFLKGAVLKIGTAMYKPLNLTEASGAVSVLYIKADTSTPTTAVCGVLSSAEE